ncbi:MAG: cytochrome P450 [Phycisphaerales bacterium]
MQWAPMVVVSPIHTHRMPEWWPAPDRFDPERFSPERAEDTRHTHMWIPFGGGPHHCIGLRFAELQVKAIMHQLLSRYRISVEPGYEMPVQQAPISRPRDGLPVRFEPIGSTQTIEVDVRVVLATNQSLEKLVADGTFRQDLYYRINVVKLELPSLRDRMSDIPLLVDHFMKKHSAEHSKPIVAISDEAIETLQRYPYPGNVRELENIIERAVVLSSRPTIGLDDLPQHVIDGKAPMHAPSAGFASAPDDPDAPWKAIPLAEALEEPEKRILLKALRANDWNRQQTADDLGINRTTLYKKIKAYQLDRLAG